MDKPTDKGILCDAFHYDRETGDIYRRAPRASWFKRRQDFLTYKKRWMHKKVGHESQSTGYLYTHFFGNRYAVHRLAWFLGRQVWPEGEIDHINGIRSDNRWDNLRDVTKAENARNKRLSVRNTSGLQGVRWFEARSKWEAYISNPTGVREHLGTYGSLLDACCARKSKEGAYGYHVNHGG